MGKNSKKNNGNNFADQVQIFIIYGLYVGVLIPFASMAIILINPNFTNPVVESRKIWVMDTMGGYIFVMFMIGFYILVLYRKEYSKRRNSIAEVLLYILGFLSLFVLYFLILWTGGLTISPFSGYFIYVPVVVFLSFGGKFSKVLLAGVLSIVLAVCSTPIIINSVISIIKNPFIIRFFPSTLKSVTPWIVTAEYQLHYLIVVITQVVASILVAYISGPKTPKLSKIPEQ